MLGAYKMPHRTCGVILRCFCQIRTIVATAAARSNLQRQELLPMLVNSLRKSLARKLLQKHKNCKWASALVPPTPLFGLFGGSCREREREREKSLAGSGVRMPLEVRAKRRRRFGTSCRRASWSGSRPRPPGVSKGLMKTAFFP